MTEKIEFVSSLFYLCYYNSKMSINESHINKVFSWQTGAEYLNKHPDIQSYSICSHDRMGYLLVRTQINGIYLQNTYDGSKLVSCVIMDANEDF